MRKTWILPQTSTPQNNLLNNLGCHPLITQTLIKRGFTDVISARGFLDPTFYSPSPPTEIPHLSRAADRIEEALHKHESILVWGDFDVDGQTATTLLVESLRELGGGINFHIPVRDTEGHGIQLDVLKIFLSKFPGIKLIITCDTGISEHEALEFAQSQGVDVIITDHHELPETLPKVFSAVNPHLLPEYHPLKSLPGVGVAYKLVEELLTRAGRESESKRYLDLVALGIVADVAEVTGDTRYLLQEGLKVLGKTTRLGLKQLYEIANINPALIREDTIGFGIAPRLNAMGRLSDANPIVEFFTTNDLTTSRVLANQLEGLNLRRRLLTDQVYQGALAQIERDPSLLNYSALVLDHPGWPNGVIGIVASRLVDRFGLPAVLLNIQENDMAIGSARSVEGIHIRDSIASQEDLLIGFGGHAGAAGLSLSAQDIPEFRTRLSRTIKKMGAYRDFSPKLNIDAIVQLSDLSLEFVNEIERLAPFGAGNPQLVLVSEDLKILSATRIGRSKEHLKLVVGVDGGITQEVLWWRGVGEEDLENLTHFDLAYIPRSVTFRGEQKLQIQWVDHRINVNHAITVDPEPPTLEIVDYRNEPDHYHLLDAIRSGSDVQVWAEGDVRQKIGGMDRYHLITCNSLAIWTTPPGFWELQTAFELANPEVIYLFTHKPEIDELNRFLGFLAGLVKHILNKKDGVSNLEDLAAITSQKESTALLGLLWLEAKGVISIRQKPGEDDGFPKKIVISKGTGISRSDLTEITRELKSLLDETAAFRDYLGKTRVESLKLALSRNTNIT
jgi:single-stranded-DNA-specific exonuclease